MFAKLMFTAIVSASLFASSGAVRTKLASCCSPDADCCNPPQACCVTGSCCETGASCCEPGASCCEE